MSNAITVTSQPEVGPTLEFGTDEQQTEEAEIYLDGTLVLIGCGKEKRDPGDPTDLHVAAVGPDEEFRNGTGPAWEAQNLYTHWYFRAKADFAEIVSSWANDVEGGPPGWAILSAEHGILYPWEKVRHYDTTIEDLGGDESNPDHHVRNPYCRRRPDGREIVTERDLWATNVAYKLASWQADFRDQPGPFAADRANTLLVLAGEKYIDPLRERGVFEYGISKMVAGANGPLLPVKRTRFLFEELDAGGNGEQGSWLHDATDRVESHLSPDSGEQATLSGVR
ncbi:MAG: DUF6884 domain-containing protein [Halodesulfurarchaeum sp.]